MAIRWGSRVTRATGSWQQLGIEATISGTTITVKYYGNSNGVNGTWTLTRTGGITGGVSVAWNNSGGQTLLHTATRTGTRGTTYTFGASYPTWWGGPAVTVSGETITVPVLAPLAPGAPTIARVSDTQHTVTWVRNASTDRPYDNQRVQRQVSSAPGVWSEFSQVAQVAGNITTYSDTTTVAGRQYRYRIVAHNSAGYATSGNSLVINTSPNVPTNLVAQRVGSDIDVTGQSVKIDSGTVYHWEDNPNGAGWVTVSGTTATPNRLFESPNAAQTHSYRSRAAVSSGTTNPTTLYSDWSTPTAVVQLQAKPNPPTLLSPIGTVEPVGNVTFRWQHNPTDSSAQTRFSVRYRTVGSGTWTTISLDSSSQAFFTALTAGNYEWQASTKGAHATMSDWSPSSLFSVAAAPVVVINEPTGTQSQPSVLVTWGYSQAQGSPQAQWQVNVFDDYGATIASGSGTGTTSSWTTPEVLQNKTTHTVQVRARAANQIWSEWDETEFYVDYPPPVPVDVSAVWNDGQGHVTIDITPGIPTGLEDPAPRPADHVMIERSLDGGMTWKTIVENLPLETTASDWESPSIGTIYYRVTTISDIGTIISENFQVEVSNRIANRVVWLSGTPSNGYTTACMLAFNVDISYEGGASRVVEQYDGRTRGVERSSNTRVDVLSVSATVVDRPDQVAPDSGMNIATRRDLEALFRLVPGPFLYRDFEGRLMYGTVGKLRWEKSSTEPGRAKVSFTITESDPMFTNQILPPSIDYEYEVLT